jgi:carbon monoxide dehydrogenase subunit G
MDMVGEYIIPAPREAVWHALNDPQTLKACLPGCETIEVTGEHTFNAAMSAKIGPVKAKFTSELALEEVDPPNGYVITGQGKGGAAGFAKGSARVSLTDVAEGTSLVYEVDMQVGGKLAQIGSRLVAGAARKIADQFFARLAGQFDESGDASA